MLSTQTQTEREKFDAKYQHIKFLAAGAFGAVSLY
jgi:hypothetical protein